MVANEISWPQLKPDCVSVQKKQQTYLEKGIFISIFVKN